MTAKENALRIIRFQCPERIATGIPQHGLAYFGCNHESPADGIGHERSVGSRWSDIWGTVWQKEQPGVMGFPQIFPLETPSRLASYRWPDPDAERCIRPIYDAAASFLKSADKFLSGSHRDTLWEKAYMLVGMENLMVYMLTEPAYAREIFRRVMDFQIAIARHYLAAGIELANLTDDLGSQCGPLMHPDLVREFLLPEYRRLVELYHGHRVLINFHSCGNIEAMIPMFLEMGIDILNPVQATANNLDNVRSLTQGHIALQGGVSSATVMSGPPEEIAAETRLRMRQLGEHGGYFCDVDQWMPFPQPHLEAFRNTVETYGTYPLR